MPGCASVLGPPAPVAAQWAAVAWFWRPDVRSHYVSRGAPSGVGGVVPASAGLGGPRGRRACGHIPPVSSPSSRGLSSSLFLPSLLSRGHWSLAFGATSSQDPPPGRIATLFPSEVTAADSGRAHFRGAAFHPTTVSFFSFRFSTACASEAPRPSPLYAAEPVCQSPRTPSVARAGAHPQGEPWLRAPPGRVRGTSGVPAGPPAPGRRTPSEHTSADRRRLRPRPPRLCVPRDPDRQPGAQRPDSREDLHAGGRHMSRPPLGKLQAGLGAQTGLAPRGDSRAGSVCRRLPAAPAAAWGRVHSGVGGTCSDLICRRFADVHEGSGRGHVAQLGGGTALAEAPWQRGSTLSAPGSPSQRPSGSGRPTSHRRWWGGEAARFP